MKVPDDLPSTSGSNSSVTSEQKYLKKTNSSNPLKDLSHFNNVMPVKLLDEPKKVFLLQNSSTQKFKLFFRLAKKLWITNQSL